MVNGAPSAAPAGLPPELLQTIAEAVGAALAKQPADGAGQADAPKTPGSPADAGQVIGAALAPLAAPVLAKAESKLKSRKLWVTIGTLAGLLAQNPLGLQLHPAAQVAIAALAAIFVAAQAIVDSAKQGGGNG